jgi:D-beta-D-heptose 7-phosphate kinase/D-beta-D-heptose 1-phosphate adenosyltransferase
MSSQLSDIVRRFSMLNAVVIGEAMLDRYSTGQGKRLSVEAPVPIVDNCSTLNFAGAAANTAINLRSLGARVTYVSAVGDDSDATALQEILMQHNVNVNHLHRVGARQTLSKHRVFASSQMIARFDHGTTTELDRDTERNLTSKLDHLVPDADVVVLSDYGYGIFTPRLIEHLARLLRRNPCCVAADSRRLPLFASLVPTVVKPNYREAVQLLNIEEKTSGRARQLSRFGPQLLELTAARTVAATLDEGGAVVFEDGHRPFRTTADPKPHSQAAGAGDTYLAAFALALASRADTKSAAEIAASAASVVVEKTYTAACSTDELLMAIGAKSTANDLAGLAVQMERYRQAGRRIVLTNGCFDILHRGHVAYLERAKSLGDVLVVGVNSDSSIRQLKGPSRPINCLEDRLGVLAALSCVDHLVSFDETRPDHLVEAIRPDVFVKGGDYTRRTLPEARLVEALGGRVVILPYLADHSTTDIVQRIRQSEVAPLMARNGRISYAPASLGERSQRTLH